MADRPVLSAIPILCAPDQPPSFQKHFTVIKESDIRVLGVGNSSPFSKGILSQSLLAASIEPSIAFEIARNIEQDIRAKNLLEIDRNELRMIVHRVLLAEAGEAAASSYLLWRRYEELETPVVLLLGGTSGVGKTALALEVARRLGIGRVLSTDSIRQVMRLMISQELMPWIHTSSFEAYQTLPQMGDIAPDVLSGFRTQAASVGVGVRASIDRSIEEGANLVVDGVSLLPGVINPASYSKQAIVVFVLVAALEEHTLRDRFKARASGQPKRLASRYLQHFEAIAEIQRHLVSECDRQRIPVVDNVDLDRSAREIISYVLDRVRFEQTSKSKE